MTRILVTGGDGFIARNLEASHLGNVASGVTFVTRHGANVLDEKRMDQIAEHSDVIIHLAAKNKGDDEDILRTNILGTYHLCTSCLRHGTKLIVAGSDYEFGAYGASKKINQKTVEEFYRLGMNGVYMHIPKVFGKQCKPFFNSFVSTVMHCAANKIEFRHMVRAEDVALQLIHVDDLCRQMTNLCRADFHDPFQVMPNYLVVKDVNIVSLGTFCDFIEGKEPFPETPFGQKIKETFEWYKLNASIPSMATNVASSRS